MTCGNCALTISRLLEKKGMKNIAANAASGAVSFTSTEDTDVEKLFDAIDELGYKVVRDQDASANGAQVHEHRSDKETMLLITCALFYRTFAASHVYFLACIAYTVGTICTCNTCLSHWLLCVHSKRCAFFKTWHSQYGCAHHIGRFRSLYLFIDRSAFLSRPDT